MGRRKKRKGKGGWGKKKRERKEEKRREGRKEKGHGETENLYLRCGIVGRLAGLVMIGYFTELRRMFPS